MKAIKTIAASFALVAMGAQAANVSELDLTSQVKNLVSEIPTVNHDGFKVGGPIFTREVIGFDGDDAIYGDIKGVVTTREVVGFDANEDEPVYGGVRSVAFALELTPEQIAAQNANDDD